MKRLSTRIPWLSALIPICFQLGCTKKEIPEAQNPTISTSVERTVLVYIAANNDLRNEAINSVLKMQKGAKALEGNLLVFVKTNPLNSCILKIKHGTGDKIVSDTLKVYKEENSSEASFLARVIKDVRTFAPAKTYGLVLWSHATAWTPPSSRISTMSFGRDNGREMDLLDMKTALPGDFEYIIFDACSMASIEVVYEIQGKAKYILASPAEVLITGFPYEKITEHLFTGVRGLKQVSALFINHYKSLPGRSSSATVSLIATEELPLIASLTKTLMQNTVKMPFSIDVREIQRLDFEEAPAPAYDFLDFFEKNFDEEAIGEVKKAVKKAVLFKEHTETFLGNPIHAYSGLTVYVPDDHSYANYYKTLAWHDASGWEIIFGSVLHKFP